MASTGPPLIDMAPEPGGFFPVLRRRAIVVAATTGIALIVGHGLTQRASPSYEARTDLLVGPLPADIATIRAATSATETYAQLAQAPATVTAVARATAVDREDLVEGLRIRSDPEARILTIRARATTAEGAAAAANGVADRLIEVASGDPADPSGRLRRVDVATVPPSPVGPGPVATAALAATGGMLGGLGLVMVLVLIGDPARTAADVRRATRGSVLNLPARPGTGGRRGGTVLAAQLALARPGVRSVLFTGTAAFDGYGELALELAAAWSASPEERVVVVDAGSVDGEEPGRVVADIVAAGSAVVVHAPPATATVATLAWARAVEVTVLVSRLDTGRRGLQAEAAEALRRVGADLALTAVHPGGPARAATVAGPARRHRAPGGRSRRPAVAR